MSDRLTKPVAVRSRSEYVGKETEPMHRSSCDPRLMRAGSKDADLRASPSLKWVIKPNSVQSKKEMFERISQSDVVVNSLQLPPNGGNPLNGSSARGQVKSESCIGMASGPMVIRQLRWEDTNSSDHSSGKKAITEAGAGGVWFTPVKPTVVLPPEVGTNAGEGVTVCGSKPQVRPKPSVTGRNLSIESSTLERSCKSGDLGPNREAQTQLPVTPERDDVFCTKDSNNNSAVKELSPQQSNLQELKQQTPRARSFSVPAPPPKPPRILHEVFPTLRERPHVDSESGTDGKYDRLTNSVSVMMPMAYPRMETHSDDMSQDMEVPKETPDDILGRDMDHKVSNVYEQINDVIPLYSEVKKPKSSEAKPSEKKEPKKKKVPTATLR